MLDPEQRAWRFWRPGLAPALAPAAVLALVGMLFYTFLAVYRDLGSFLRVDLRLQQLNGTILLLDESLSMSARMAAATGDPRWEARYGDLERELAAVRIESERLAADVYSSADSEATWSANDALVKLEHEALALVRRGQLAQAAEILSSAKYAEWKKVYANGMKSVSAAIVRRGEAGISGHRQRMNGVALVGIVLCGLLGGLGIREGSAVRREAGSRARAEKSLSQSEARVRAVQDSSLDPIVTIDIRGIIQTASRSVEPVLGWTPDELIGKNVEVLVPEPDRASHDGYVERYLRTGKSQILGQRREVEAVRRDGSRFPCELRVVRVDVPDEPDPLFAATVHDISQRRLLKLQLLTGQKLEAIGQLAAGIAHEINTPLQYVGDNTRFLKDSFARLSAILAHCRDALFAQNAAESTALRAERAKAMWDEDDVDFLLEEIPSAIEQSQNGIDRVSAIVRAMKEFSHPGRKDKTETDLNRALETTITVARNEWKYVADVVTELDPELPPVLCYPGELNQVFLNLLVNAAHAIRDSLKERGVAKGTITVSTQRLGEWAEIRMRDSGTGIPEAVRERIFEPFFTTKDVGEGTGQGLAIARSVVVDKHQGTIDFETESGRGTTFIIRLPISQPAVEPDPGSA